MPCGGVLPPFDRPFAVHGIFHDRFELTRYGGPLELAAAHMGKSLSRKGFSTALAEMHRLKFGDERLIIHQRTDGVDFRMNQLP